MTTKKITDLVASQLTTQEVIDTYIPISGIGADTDELHRINFTQFKAMLLDNKAVVPHEYWRVFFDANNATSFCGLTEVQFFKAGSITNAITLAPGTPISSGGTPALAFDNGASSSGWNDTGTNGAWIGYHFGKAVGIARVRLTAAQFTDQSPKDFRVQYSDDGVTWTDAFAVTGQTGWINGEVRQFIDPDPIWIDAGDEGVGLANKRLWAYYDGPAAVLRAGNGLTVTKNGTGNYAVTFDVPRQDTNYAVILGGADMGYQFGTIPSLAYSSKTVDGFSLNCFTNQNDSYSDLLLSIEVIDATNDTLGGFTDAPLDGKIYARKNGRWVLVGGSGTVERVKAAAYIAVASDGTPTIVKGLNVASVSRLSVGHFRVNFTTSLDSNQYGVNVTSHQIEYNDNAASSASVSRSTGEGFTTQHIDILCSLSNANAASGQSFDPEWISFEIFDPAVQGGGGGGGGSGFDEAPLDHKSYVRNMADWVQPTTADLTDIDYTVEPTSGQALLWNPGAGKYVPSDVVTRVAKTYETWGAEIQYVHMTFENGVSTDILWKAESGTTILDPDAGGGTQYALQFGTGGQGDNASNYFDFPVIADSNFFTFTVRYKSQGERNYDGIIVYLDGVQLTNRYTIDTDYVEFSFNMAPGNHVVRFLYHSDGSAQSGYQNCHFSKFTYPKKVGASAYKRGDTVRDFNGKSWFCELDDTTQQPGIGTDWSEFAGSTALVDLTDVDLATTPPSSGQALVFDSVTNKWKPGSVAASTGGTSSSGVNGDTGKVFVAGGTFRFDGTATPAFADLNGCSVGRIAAGRYQITFDKPMDNTYYGVICSGHWGGADGNGNETPIVGMDRGPNPSITTNFFYLISTDPTKTPYDSQISFAVYKSASALTAILGSGSSAAGSAALANIKQTLKIAEVEHSVLAPNTDHGIKFDYKIDWGGVVALAYHGSAQSSDPFHDTALKATYTVPAGKKVYMIEGWGGDQNYGNGGFYAHRLYNVTQNKVITSPNSGQGPNDGWNLTQGGNLYTGNADGTFETAKVIAVAGDTIICQMWNPSGDSHYRMNFGAYVLAVVDATTNKLATITSEGLIGSSGGGVMASTVSLGAMTTVRGIGTLTATMDNNHGVVLNAVASGAHGYSGLFRPIAPVEQITIRITNGSRSGNPNFGIGYRDNANNIVLWGNTFNNGTYYERTYALGGADWAADTGTQTSIWDLWLRVNYTQSTNTMVCSQSNDGVHWTVVSTNNTSITPTEIGIALRDYGTAAGGLVGGVISYFEDVSAGVSFSRTVGYDPSVTLAKSAQFPSFEGNNGKVLAVNDAGTGTEWVGAETVLPDSLEVELAIPAFATGFAEFGSGYNPTRIWKSGRTVHMTTTVKATADTTSGQTIFTLPNGWRPVSNISAAGEHNGAHIQWTIGSNGIVACSAGLSSGSYSSISVSWLVLDQYAYLPQIATSQEVLVAYEDLSIVQQTQGAQINNNSQTLILPAAPQPSSTLFMFIATYSAAAVTPPPHATLLYGTFPAANQAIYVYTIPSDGATTNYPVAINDGGIAIIYELSGAVVNFDYTYVGGLGTPFSAHFNQGTPGSLRFWMAEHDSGAAITIDTPPAGVTVDYNSGQMSGNVHAGVVGRMDDDFGGYITGSGVATTGSFIAGFAVRGKRKTVAVQTGGSGGGTASYPSFTGNKGKVLTVNTAETGVEWTTETVSDTPVSNVVAKAKIISASDGTLSLIGATNIASVVRTAAGTYTVNFTNPIPAGCTLRGNGKFSTYADDTAMLVVENRRQETTTTQAFFHTGNGTTFYDIAPNPTTGGYVYIEIINPTVPATIGTAPSASAVGAHRYWQMRNLQTSGDYTNFSASRIELHSSVGGAALPVSIITAPVYPYQDWAIARVIDNDDSNAWASSYSASVYIEFDMGVPVNVAEVLIKARTDAAPNQTPCAFDFYFSDDAHTWTLLNRIETTPYTTLSQVGTFVVPDHLAGGSGGGASALTALSDVNLTTAPTDGQALVYDAASAKWHAGSVSAGGSNWSVEAVGTGVSQNVTLPVAVSLPVDVAVFTNGLKVPASAYTVSGTTLTLTTNAIGDKIEVVNK